MKNHIGAFALLLPLAFTGVGSAFAAEDGVENSTAAAKCSNATLRGTYLFAYEGFTVSGKDRGPFAVAGYETFDGRGNIRSVNTFSLNGKITRFARIPGKYTINPDCTGTSSYTDGSRYDQFVAPDGSQFVFVQTNPGTVAATFEPRATAHRVGD
jgi:hypothetical protein